MYLRDLKRVCLEKNVCYSRGAVRRGEGVHAFPLVLERPTSFEVPILRSSGGGGGRSFHLHIYLFCKVWGWVYSPTNNLLSCTSFCIRV